MITPAAWVFMGRRHKAGDDGFDKFNPEAR